MWKLIPVLFGAASLFAQARPGLFFREDWKEIPAATPVTQEHVVSPDLILSLYGPARASIKKSHHDAPADDPYYIWSGDCQANWAVSLRHKSALVDLTGLAKIRWRSKQSGFRQLRSWPMARGWQAIDPTARPATGAFASSTSPTSAGASWTSAP
jgi:hypothetical protein